MNNQLIPLCIHIGLSKEEAEDVMKITQEILNESLEMSNIFDMLHNMIVIDILYKYVSSSHEIPYL